MTGSDRDRDDALASLLEVVMELTDHLADDDFAAVVRHTFAEHSRRLGFAFQGQANLDESALDVVEPPLEGLRLVPPGGVPSPCEPVCLLEPPPTWGRK